MLNDPMAISAETHRDFWEDDMDYSETVTMKVLIPTPEHRRRRMRKRVKTAHRKGK